MVYDAYFGAEVHTDQVSLLHALHPWESVAWFKVVYDVPEDWEPTDPTAGRYGFHCACAS